MKCRFCGGETKIMQTLLDDRDNTVYRRRKCLKCDKLNYTFEMTEELEENEIKHIMYKLREAKYERKPTKREIDERDKRLKEEFRRFLGGDF